MREPAGGSPAVEAPPAGPGFRLESRHRRVGIVCLGGIGDAVHALPIATAIRRARPDVRIVWVAEPVPADLVEYHPAVDERVVFRPDDGFRGVAKLRRRLSGATCDVTLNLRFYGKSIFPTLFLGSPVRIGLPPSKTRDGVSLFHTHHLPEGPWKHVQALYLDFLDFIGVPREPVEWGLALSPGERTEQGAFFEPFRDTPVVGLVLASAQARKDWEPGRYAALANALVADLGYAVVLVGGPGRREREAAETVTREASVPVVSGLADSVRRLLWTLGGCDLVVSPDTGPLHIAHALGIPVIGLFGHTNPWRVGPYRDYHDLVIDRYTEPGAEPDPTLVEPRRGRIGTITVDDVLDRVEVARTRYGAGVRRPVLLPAAGVP